jgi:tetratricopeptide (TPR) repeat protein
MQGHFDDLGQLTAVSETELLHLLTCPDCRRRAIDGLLKESASAGEEEDTHDDSPLSASLEDVDLFRFEEVQARKAEAARQFEELMGMSAEEWLGALQAPGFRSSEFLDTLLEQCHARQLLNPRQAAEIGRLAAQLAADLIEEEEGPVEHLHRALCLEMNALRLAGEVKEEHLGRMAVSPSSRENRAFYCRLLAIVRWEQGRADEAAALLQYAEALYRHGLPSEQGVCLALRGLLAAEEDNVGDALPCLHQGWALMDRDLRPQLALRVALSLSFCFAAASQEEQARCFYDEALRLLPVLRDPEETVRVMWLQARVLARLGQKGEARDLLQSVLRALGAENSLAEAILAGLDLALLSESAEMGTLVDYLGSIHFEPQDGPVLDLVLDALYALEVYSAKPERIALERKVIAVRDSLRRTFRARGLPMKPLPFA